MALTLKRKPLVAFVLLELFEDVKDGVDEYGRRDLCHGSKLALIQPPSITLDGTLQTACPVICLLTVT